MNIKQLLASTKGQKTAAAKTVLDIAIIKAGLESSGFSFEIDSELTEKSTKLYFMINYQCEEYNFSHISQYNIDKHNTQNFMFVDNKRVAVALGFDNAVKQHTTFILTEETKKEIYAIRKSMVDAYGTAETTSK